MSEPTLPGLGWLLPAAPAIELHGVAMSYQGPPELAALSPVDLIAARGDLIVVTGPAGSGKTTLLSIVGLLDRPTEGRYRFNGVDTASLSERERTALRGGQIGLVFQRPQLLASRSAIDNVALPLLYRGLPGRRRRLIAADLLDRLGVAGQADTQAGRLSDGERQLVAIARALAGGPSLLLCDEPTAGLDASCAAQVAELLIGLHADGVTVAAVTGDPLIAAHGTQRIALGHRQHADLRPGAGR